MQVDAIPVECDAENKEIISGFPSAQENLFCLVRFQVLTAALMMFRAVFWVILPCNDHSSLMMEAVRTCETSVDNHFTRQYNPEDSSEHYFALFQEKIP
jgi:hypothetical protein